MPGADAPTAPVAPGPTVASGAATVVGGQMVVYALGLVASVVIARSLGPAGRGEYYLPVVAATIALIVGNLGVELANTVAASERGISLVRLARTSALLACIVGPVALLLAVGAYTLTDETLFRGIERSNFLLAALSVPFAIHLLWLTNLFLLARRFARAQLATVIGATVQTGAVVALGAAGALGVRETLILFDASILVSWSLLVVWSHAFAPARPGVDSEALRAVFSIGLRVYPGLLLIYLLMRSDTLLVNAYLTRQDVGIYSLAVLFAELVWLVTTPLAQALLPFQSSMSLRSSVRLSFKAARFNAALATVLAAVFAATLWAAIPLVYGRDFAPAYSALVVLLPGVMAMALSRPLGVILARDEDRPWAYSAAAVGAFLVNLVLNVALIPPLGIVGAGVASSIAYAGLCAVYVGCAIRLGNIPLGEALRPGREDWMTLRSLPVRALAAVRR